MNWLVGSQSFAARVFFVCMIFCFSGYFQKNCLSRKSIGATTKKHMWGVRFSGGEGSFIYMFLAFFDIFEWSSGVFGVTLENSEGNRRFFLKGCRVILWKFVWHFWGRSKIHLGVILDHFDVTWHWEGRFKSSETCEAQPLWKTVWCVHGAGAGVGIGMLWGGGDSFNSK